ncbi:hypothetical protein Sste5346_002173 [Sporothrix stenoceras]|uniref:Nephrocystin 3-like N-terminal domain-containing protein n=1 Tax=Sporothrix stenoceras TaxID=5173 RepID=A0ABR3ZLZ4_9PEZI
MSLRAAIAPETYDERLAWYQENCLAGTAQWLFDNRNFHRWADLTKGVVPSRWIYLHGIPGSGKSHVAAAAVDHIRLKMKVESHSRPVLYGLINHTSKLGLTTLSVLKALLFQVVEDDPDLQCFLIQSKMSDLRGSVTRITELLEATLLPMSGAEYSVPSYIVVDGIDEMEETERLQLLRQLCVIADACANLRIMVSSREEHDIAATAKKQKAKAICVNANNEHSIEAYVNHRM